jgi:DNA polymerase
MLGFDTACTVEIKRITRHPSYPRSNGQTAGSIHIGANDDSIGSIAAWLKADASSSEVAAWLADNGYVRGESYPHERCLIDPAYASHGTPVHVGDRGLSCMSCKAYGKTFPSCSSAGYVPFDRLTSGPRTATRIRKAVEHFTHFGHAKHILAEDYPRMTADLRRPVYAALLKAIHEPGDPRIEWALRDLPFKRGEGNMWLHGDTLEPIQPRLSPKALVAFASTYNAWQEMNKDLVLEWVVKQDAVKLEQHNTNANLPGYPPIIRVPGIKLWGQFCEYGDDSLRVVTTHIRSARYLGSAHRMPTAEQEQRLRELFPGIQLSYLRLLIVARGFAEAVVGPLPIIVVTGPSGAAKSTTLKVAASIIGDKAEAIEATAKGKDFREAFGYAIQRAGFAYVDDFLKHIRPDKAALELNHLIQLDTDFTFRALYIGPVRATVRSAFILTDTAVPVSIQQDKQIGRRLIHVQLPGEVPNWELNVNLLTWLQDEANAKLADSFLSDAIDKYLSGGYATFREAAAALGYGKLYESGLNAEGDDKHDRIRNLFNAVCAAPTATGWKGEGWKEVTQGGTDALAKAWLNVCDNIDFGWTRSRVLEEETLSKVLGKNEELVRCEISARRNAAVLAVRFTNGASPRSNDFRVNEQLRPLLPQEGGHEQHNRNGSGPVGAPQLVDSPDAGGGSGGAAPRDVAGGGGDLDWIARLAVSLGSGVHARRDAHLRVVAAPERGSVDAPRVEGESAGGDGVVATDTAKDGFARLGSLIAARGRSGAGEVAGDAAAGAAAGSVAWIERLGTALAGRSALTGVLNVSGDSGDSGDVDDNGRVHVADSDVVRGDARRDGVVLRLDAIGAPVAFDPANVNPVVWIDFETRSHCDLKRAGARNYAAHPTTEILSLAALMPDRTLIYWVPLMDQPAFNTGLLRPQMYEACRVREIKVYGGWSLPQELRDAVEAGLRFAAHNGNEFDALIWRHKVDAPEPKCWIDTMIYANALNLPRKLDHIGRLLFKLGKDKGQNVLHRLSTPRGNGLYLPPNNKNMHDVLRYNGQDVLLEQRFMEEGGFDAAISDYEKRVQQVDLEINARGIQVNTELVAALLDVYNASAAQRGEDLKQFGLTRRDLNSPKRMQEWLKSKGVIVDNLQASTIEAALAKDDEIEEETEP